MGARTDCVRRCTLAPSSRATPSEVHRTPRASSSRKCLSMCSPCMHMTICGASRVSCVIQTMIDPRQLQMGETYSWRAAVSSPSSLTLPSASACVCSSSRTVCRHALWHDVISCRSLQPRRSPPSCRGTAASTSLTRTMRCLWLDSVARATPSEIFPEFASRHVPHPLRTHT